MNAAEKTFAAQEKAEKVLSLVEQALLINGSALDKELRMKLVPVIEEHFLNGPEYRLEE